MLLVLCPETSIQPCACLPPFLLLFMAASLIPDVRTSTDKPYSLWTVSLGLEGSVVSQEGRGKSELPVPALFTCQF